MRRLAPLALALLLAACDSGETPPPPDPPRTETIRIAYEVRAVAPYGANQIDVVRYTGGDGSTGSTTNRTLPWRISFSAPDSVARVYDLEASVTAGGQARGIEARITVDGILVSQQTVPGEQGGLTMTSTARAVYRHQPE